MVVAAAIDFYCIPVFHLSPFSIENLDRFRARSSLASKLKRGRPGQALFEHRLLFRCLTRKELRKEAVVRLCTEPKVSSPRNCRKLKQPIRRTKCGLLCCILSGLQTVATMERRQEKLRDRIISCFLFRNRS